MPVCAGSLARRTAAGLLAAGLLLAGPAGAGAPARVMSLNLCADVLLLHLAEREQIASLTFLAASSPLSPVTELAQGLPANHGSAEEVIALDPDLVLVHRYSNTQLLQALEALGYRLWKVDAPATLEAAAVQMEELSQVLGTAARGRQLASTLRNLPSSRGDTGTPAPVVAIYGPNGMTAGRGSLLHDLLQRVGLANFAALHELPATDRIPLELLLQSPPDGLVLSGESSHRRDTLAQFTLHHPALEALGHDRPRSEIPGRYWSCGGPEIIEAHRRLQLLKNALAAKGRKHD